MIYLGFAMKPNIKDTVEQYDNEIMSELCDQRTTKHFLHLTLGEMKDLK